MERVILAGDVGGTSARLALFEGGPGDLRPVAAERYRSRDHAGLGAIVSAFAAAHPARLERACFGIAGPVREGRVETPNLPWVIESGDLADRLGLPGVTLLNDLEANAYGVFTLDDADFAPLNEGRPQPDGNAAIISAGTGLGEAGYYASGGALHPFATEGGHADFAPNDALEAELLAWLRARLGGHVSVERVVSGPGLENIYTFLRERGAAHDGPWPADAAMISQTALSGGSATASAALDRFVSIYGAEAGNLALKMQATRGVYVGGGIAPKILPRLKNPGFMSAFVDKGRFRAFMERIPVKVILNDQTALRGAAWHALSSPR